MPRLRLFHWNVAEAEAVLKLLREAKFEVDYSDQMIPGILRSLKVDPPAAVVIDLSRMPSHGREVAIALRGAKATRLLPIVFCDGDKEKVEALRKKLPDAAYTVRSKLIAAIHREIRRPRSSGSGTAPVVPAQMMERYGDRTAPEKLGIAAGSKLGLFALPKRAPAVLNQLPANVDLVEDELDQCGVVLCFAETVPGLQAALDQVRRLTAAGAGIKTWVLWPKKSAAASGQGLTQQLIREQGALLGLVDYKICSVDAVWSGMLFTLRRSE